MSRTVQSAWPVVTYPCDVAGVAPEVLSATLTSASTWLWALSGRRVGAFTTVEDRYRGASDCGICAIGAYKDGNGFWRNGIQPTNCCSLTLESQPVKTIVEVRLSGVVLDPAAYVLEGNTIVRLGQCWPCDLDCQAAPIEVDYTWGVPVDVLGLEACAELTCEFIAGMTGQACRLPSRAVSVSRQGVSIEMQDAQQFADNGLTGLPICDAWIRTLNPGQLQQRSRAISVDYGRRV